MFVEKKSTSFSHHKSNYLFSLWSLAMLLCFVITWIHVADGCSRTDYSEANLGDIKEIKKELTEVKATLNRIEILLNHNNE